VADVTRSDRLAAFLDAAASRPFAWGAHDCLTGLLGPWVAQETGIDPVADWGRRLSGQVACCLAVHRAGGMVAFVTQAANRVRLRMTLTPQLGDIGVVSALTEDGRMMVGAISLGEGRAAMLSTIGLQVGPMVFARAWAL
jgi:hypothetical protein